MQDLGSALSQLGDGAYAVANAMSGKAEDYGNDPKLEEAWALKAFEHARIHMNLLCALEPRGLKLCPMDNEIYEQFRRDFPQLNVQLIDENLLKSDNAKAEWRTFIEKFEKQVEDFNFATLLRLDSSGRYDSENTTLVPRLQFLAIEIARNREGCNSGLRTKFQGQKFED